MPRFVHDDLFLRGGVESSVTAIHRIQSGKMRYGRYIAVTNARSCKEAASLVAKVVRMGAMVVAVCAPYTMQADRNQSG